MRFSHHTRPQERPADEPQRHQPERAAEEAPAGAGGQPDRPPGRVVNYNYQDHWAHRHRDEAARSPAAVLAWVHGRAFSPEELHHILDATRFGRRVDRLSYVRFRHWRDYTEQGLQGEQLAVWLDGEHLTLAFADEPLAQYWVTSQPDKRHLRTVTEPHLFETPLRSAQLPLWELGDGKWLKVLQVREHTPRKSRPSQSSQVRLFS
jgi:hypothetical protein